MSDKRQHFSEIISKYEEICSGGTILMSSPEYIGIRPPNGSGHSGNDKEAEFYQEFANDPQAFRDKAVQQWHSLKDQYEQRGFRVVCIPSYEGQFDQVFTADPILSVLNPEEETLLVLRSAFTNVARNSEAMSALTLPWHKLFDEHDVHMLAMNNKFEGTGDCVYDPARGIYWAGYTFNPDSNNPAAGRSSQRAHDEFSKVMSTRVVSLESADGCFHVDTCLATLPTGHMLVYKDGMTPESYELLREVACIEYGLDPDEYLIDVSQNDAKNNFATNLICTGRDIYISEFGEDVAPVDAQLITRLEDIGYKVNIVPYGQMIKVGGAVHCTSQLVQPLIKGGLLNSEAATEVPASWPVQMSSKNSQELSELSLS